MPNDLCHSENFTFPCGVDTLAATIDWNAAKDNPSILSLHGGGPSARTRVGYLTDMVSAAGHSCLRFDHSGQGESSGRLENSSLKKRTAEALAAVQFMDTTKPVTLIATSMGGPIALELLKHLSVKTLILFCPAAYAAEAFDIPFDSGFTDILRQPESYLHATIFSSLEKFSGNFLHVIGAEDTVIPKGATELYHRHSQQAAKRDFMVMPAWPHNMHHLFPTHEAEKQRLFDKIKAML